MSDTEQNPLNQEQGQGHGQGQGQGQGLSTAQLAGAQSDSTEKVAQEPKSFGDGHGMQAGEHAAPLLPEEEISDLRGRWTDIQGGFVDEPRRAVQQADELVAMTMKRVAETFAQERSKLEGQWDRGDQVGTEELRVAMQRYRSFFDRLLQA